MALGDLLIISPSDVLPSLHAYISKIFANYNCHDICVGGTENHVHILTSLPKNITVPAIVKLIKNSTNKLLSENYGVLKFSWQQGYAAFSVNPPNICKVKKYINHQKEHHAFISFDDELQKILRLCNS